MARGRREGVVIAGGGLAGCLAALALARFRPEVPLLIVEQGARFGGDGFRTVFRDALGADETRLVAPLVRHRWPGFYTLFPDHSRNLRAELGGFAPDALHRAMVGTLKPDQYRLGVKAVAVRDDALVLDGGEEIKAEGAIDARGAANLSMLDLLYEARLERFYRLKAPHKLDRPVLIDATRDGRAGLAFVRCLPLGPDLLLAADVAVGERAQPDGQAKKRLNQYLAARGWGKGKVEEESVVSRPLAAGGDFNAFLRIGGARVAKIGLRGFFLHPATGEAVADAAGLAMRLASLRDFSGAALHDAVEEQAKQLWRRREPLRAVTAALAAAAPEERRALMARLHALDPGTLAGFHADRLGLLDRRRLQRALRRRP